MQLITRPLYFLIIDPFKIAMLESPAFRKAEVQGYACHCWHPSRPAAARASGDGASSHL
ncbi:hypothetical protein NITMOv2_2054 [Nitrospira moscoviensis]|uniref:Uncharacterized protein n=1 Tax=Nitrospira moscoviensis TaxID=42253 RepID=A0A0K2GBZ0_NITMO|nr:hypothetical protein NITMOv2_2054 [Nitrospira moscoviensis]